MDLDLQTTISFQLDFILVLFSTEILSDSVHFIFFPLLSIPGL